MSDKDQKEKEKAKAKKAADEKKDKEKKDEPEKRKDYDIFREPPLRYFGYSNEFCKAIRPLLPCGIGNIGSIMTICYIFTDAYDKSRRYAETYKRALKEEEKKFDKSTVQKNISITAGDALLWQSLASVLIPSFLLEKTRYVTCRILQGTGSRAMIRTVPSILTLVLIPLIINPIDNLVDVVMDSTYREWFKLDDGSGNKDKEKEKEKDKKRQKEEVNE